MRTCKLFVILAVILALIKPSLGSSIWGFTGDCASISTFELSRKEIFVRDGMQLCFPGNQSVFGNGLLVMRPGDKIVFPRTTCKPKVRLTAIAQCDAVAGCPPTNPISGGSVCNQLFLGWGSKITAMDVKKLNWTTSEISVQAEAIGQLYPLRIRHGGSCDCPPIVLSELVIEEECPYTFDLKCSKDYMLPGGTINCTGTVSNETLMYTGGNFSFAFGSTGVGAQVEVGPPFLDLQTSTIQTQFHLPVNAQIAFSDELRIDFDGYGSTLASASVMIYASEAGCDAVRTNTTVCMPGTLPNERGVCTCQGAGQICGKNGQCITVDERKRALLGLLCALIGGVFSIGIFFLGVLAHTRKQSSQGKKYKGIPMSSSCPHPESFEKSKKHKSMPSSCSELYEGRA